MILRASQAIQEVIRIDNRYEFNPTEFAVVELLSIKEESANSIDWKKVLISSM